MAGTIFGISFGVWLLGAAVFGLYSRYLTRYVATEAAFERAGTVNLLWFLWVVVPLLLGGGLLVLLTS